MSYSFRSQGTTKAEVESKVREELAKVVLAQPIHETDADQAQAAAEAFLDLLPEDSTRDCYAAVSGSIYQTEKGVENASLNVTVGFGPPRA